jgi:leader peptidase (prepilin peptidase)/N-methyltransferase
MPAEMNPAWTIAAALTGGIFAVPATALAFATSADGPARLPPRWWIGAPGRPFVTALIISLGAICAALLAAHNSVSLGSAASWAFAGIALGLATTDVRVQRLPYRLTGSLYAICTTAFVVDVLVSKRPNLLVVAGLSAAVAVAVFLLVAIAMPGHLGLGDVALVGAIAFSLGWSNWRLAVIGIAAGLVTQLGVMAARRLTVRIVAESAFPFGPSLLAMWYLTMLFGGG